MTILEHILSMSVIRWLRLKTVFSSDLFWSYFHLIFLPDLKNNGIPLQACCVLEDEVDDFQILVPFQETRIILLEVVQKVVEDKVGP